MEDMGLAMWWGPKLELVSHISHSHLFLSFCKDIKVIIKGLKIKYLIFII